MSTMCDVINLSNTTYRFTVTFREYSRWLQAAVAHNTDSCQLIWLTYPVIGWLARTEFFHLPQPGGHRRSFLDDSVGWIEGDWGHSNRCSMRYFQTPALRHSRTSVTFAEPDWWFVSTERQKLPCCSNKPPNHRALAYIASSPKSQSDRCPGLTAKSETSLTADSWSADVHVSRLHS